MTNKWQQRAEWDECQRRASDSERDGLEENACLTRGDQERPHTQRSEVSHRILQQELALLAQLGKGEGFQMEDRAEGPSFRTPGTRGCRAGVVPGSRQPWHVRSREWLGRGGEFPHQKQVWGCRGTGKAQHVRPPPPRRLPPTPLLAFGPSHTACGPSCSLFQEMLFYHKQHGNIEVA